MKTQALALGSVFFFNGGFDERAFLVFFGIFGALFFSGPKIDDAFLEKLRTDYPPATMDGTLVISDSVLQLEFAEYFKYGDSSWTDSGRKYAMVVLDKKGNKDGRLRTWVLHAIHSKLAEGGKFVLVENLEVLSVITKSQGGLEK